GDPRARRSGRGRAALRLAGRGEPRGGACRQGRDRGDPEQACAVGRGAERLVRALARLGAAARRDRACHHVRSHGRHQHGARRDGDARGLYDVRGAGADPRQRSGAVRLFAGDRAAAGVPRHRRDRHPDRAHRHPLPLWPAARNPARHLGTLADPAAGGADRVRPHQPRGRCAVVDERSLRGRPHHHHLQSAVDHLFLAGGVRRAARAVAFQEAGARDARGHGERGDGGRDGHPHEPHRCAHLRARLRHRRHRRRRALPDRQCEPQSRPGLHHRFLHGRGIRRRRESVGHAGRSPLARNRQQVPRALCGRGARQDHDPGADHPLHPEAPARAVRGARSGCRRMRASPLVRGLDRVSIPFLALLAAIAVVVPLLNLAVSPLSPWYVPTYLVSLFGKYFCYALLALSIDLIWGYCGILSLGHGAFFALGGYAMGMYLMRQIGTRGVYADPILPDFMVFLNWPELPVYWYGFQYFPYAVLMVVLVPGLLAFVFGWFAFRSRVTGVYLSIITQAMTFALMLGFFRNNFGFGGNNGLTDFKDILGFNVQAPGTRAALFMISTLALMLGFVICRVVVSSKFGKVLVAIRDAEARTRFLGYRVEAYKLLVFTLSACMAGVAGALYVPQVGIINPSEFSPGN